MPWGEFSVDCDGRMHGWQCLCSGLCGHDTVADVVKHIWGSLYAQGALHGPFECENHSLADVVVFACLVAKQRRAENKTAGNALLTFQERCIYVVLTLCLGSLMSEVVRARYCDGGNDAVVRAPPAIRTPTSKRKRVAVDAGAAWYLLEKSGACWYEPGGCN